MSTIWFFNALLSFHHLGTADVIKPYAIWPVYVYYSGVIACFACSTIFHVCSNHSEEGCALSNKLDHLAIVLVNWASAIPCTYFALYDAPEQYRFTYYALITTFGLISATFTLQQRFRQPKYRRRRVYMYTLLGISAFMPVLQGLQLYGCKELNERMSLNHFLGLAIWNLSGGIIYALRIPERWYPGRFDIWGSSHQIMHVFAVCGALTNERGVLRALQYWADKQNIDVL